MTESSYILYCFAGIQARLSTSSEVTVNSERVPGAALIWINPVLAYIKKIIMIRMQTASPVVM